MKHKSVYRWLAALVVLVFLTATACVSIPTLVQSTQQRDTGATNIVPVSASVAATATPEAPAVTASPALAGVNTDAGGLQDTLMQLYRDLNPSVVYIMVTSGGTNGVPLSGASGSGFVYGADGTIVTNDHVVEAGDTYEVVFADGTREAATLLGADPDADLAVLKVDQLPDGVQPLPLGDMSSIAVGQFAVAIGSPFGEQGSMSLGIISGLGRSLPSQRSTSSGSTYSLPQVIQTDAPINPGNSGGPLLNLAGQVIGVNAAIASSSGTNSGVGFAIPVDVIKRVVPSLLADGSVTYPYMGATFDGELTLADQQAYDLPQTLGAYVVDVVPGGPAATAGLIPADPQTGMGGDLVIAIDGQTVRDFSDLNTYLVLKAQAGQTIQLTVIRDGNTITVPLTLGARP